MTTLNLFAQAVRDFADRVANNFSQHVQAQPEDQLKAPVGELITRVGAAYVTGAVSYRTEVDPDDVDGRPDLGITMDWLLVGHVELKAPGVGAQPERFALRSRNGKQWERFKALPNLIYTDGSEWSLFRSGDLAYRVRIADDITGSTSSLISSILYDEQLKKLDNLLRDFMNWEPVVPATPQGIAQFLAPLTRVLRDDVSTELGRQDSPMKVLADEWRGLLFPDASDAQVADAYAQTLTYALLLAKFEGAESLRPADAEDALREKHGLLAGALRQMEVQAVREKLLMPVQLLERAIGAVESIQLAQHADHWLYFYEHFLGAYDAKLKKDRGVYFTPVEVVRCQVRLAAELLRTRFDKSLAFADDEVTVLDPAVGTGTYPLAVLEHASEAVRDRYGIGAVSQRLANLAERLYAFEILVGPYAVSHLRISQRLRDEGVVSASANVYLTDTLESPNAAPEFPSILLQQEMNRERERAQHIKRNVPVVVCLGNPPYNRDLNQPGQAESTRRKGGWVRYGDDGPNAAPPILDDFTVPVIRAGGGVDLKPVYDDYVYFWRWALWKVFDSTGNPGIVTFITASTYLRGPGFAGMRRKMREVFDEMWIIDLEGDARATRKTENVFAIQSPVAIAIGIRFNSPDPSTPATIWKTKLIGTEREKLGKLDEIDSFQKLDWDECSTSWDTPFYAEGRGTYYDWPSVTDVFPWQVTGAALYRTWPIASTPEVLVKRWQDLVSRQGDSRRVAFRETRDRKISRSYPALQLGVQRSLPLSSVDADSDVPPITRYARRSFDRSWLLADPRVGDFMRPVLWQTFGPNQTYLTSLMRSVLGEGPAAVATAEIPDQHVFCGRGDKGIIPLWRDSDATEPNVTEGLLDPITEAHGAPTAPEKLFAYAYGILAQPSYLKSFWDELDPPPPRLPITKDGALFARVADHGARLLYLHTFATRFSGPKDDGFIPQGDARCTRAVSREVYPADFTYDYLNRAIRVGDGEFAPVAPAVWDYSVSGLQVVKSWLDYRKREPTGKKSSPLDDTLPERWDFTEDLLELLWVLEVTIDLQPEGAALLEEVCASDLFTADELPTPTDQERKPPNPVPLAGQTAGARLSG